MNEEGPTQELNQIQMKGVETLSAYLQKNVVGNVVEGERVFAFDPPVTNVSDPKAWQITIGPVNSNDPQYQRKVSMQFLWGREGTVEMFLRHFPPTLDLLTEALAGELNRKFKGARIRGRTVLQVTPPTGWNSPATDDVLDPKEWTVLLEKKFIDTNVDVKAVEVPRAELDGEPLYTIVAGEPHPDAEEMTMLLTKIVDEATIAPLFHKYYHRLYANEIPLMQRTDILARFRQLFS